MTARAEPTVPSEAALVFPGSEALILNAIPDAILVIDENNRICFANAAAEQMFDTSTAKLYQKTMDDLLPYDSPVLALVAQVWERGISVAQYGIPLATPKIEHQAVDVQVTVLAEAPGFALVKPQHRRTPRQMHRPPDHTGPGRPVPVAAPGASRLRESRMIDWTLGEASEVGHRYSLREGVSSRPSS